MKIKTAKLTGRALDWAVAVCEGKDSYCEIHAGNILYGTATSGFLYYCPSTDWAQGGPLIERESISIECKHDGLWIASNQYNYFEEKEHMHVAETPLIAAMRCYVACKFGYEISIPEGLLSRKHLAS